MITGIFIVAAIFLIMVFSIGGFIKSRGDNGFYLVGIVISGMMALALLIAVPAQRLATYQDIVTYNSIRNTVQTARQNKKISVEELAALQLKITAINVRIAQDQFYGRLPFFALCYPKQILKMEPLK